MKKIRTFTQKHAVLLYFVLTFAITWGGMVALVGPGGFPISAEQMEKMGPLVYVGMLVGPTAAALLLVGLESGETGFRQLWASLTKWRVGVRWYAVALFATPLLAAGLLLALSLISPEFVPAVFTAENRAAFLMTNIVLGLMIGLFEEIGWIGFVVPRMRRQYSVLATGMIVGLLWGAWHFPPFWESDSFAGFSPLFLLIIRLFFWLPAYRVLMVWVYERTGSLFVTILMHASLDAAMLSFPPSALTGPALVTWILVWSAALWVLVAAVAVFNRSRTARHPLQERLA